MAILAIISKQFYRRNDFYQSFCFSFLILMIYNPFCILDIGLQLSFGATLGIVLLGKDIIILLQSKAKPKVPKKWVTSLQSSLTVTLAANSIIIPIMLVHFHTISFTFLISNVLASPFLGIIIILGILICVFADIMQPLAILIAGILKIVIDLLLMISKFCANKLLSQKLCQCISQLRRFFQLLD